MTKTRANLLFSQIVGCDLPMQLPQIRVLGSRPSKNLRLLSQIRTISGGRPE